MKKIKNILSQENLDKDRREIRRRVREHIERYRHLNLPGTPALDDAFSLRDDENDVDPYENNPSDENGSWGYRAVSRDEFEEVIATGIKTEYDKELGRGVLFTCSPRIAFLHRGQGGQVLRFPFPDDAEVIVDRDSHQYDYFISKKAIKRGALEVYLDGRVDDPESWIVVGALR